MLYTLHATYIEHDLYADFSLRLERLLREFSCDRFTVQEEQNVTSVPRLYKAEALINSQ